MAPGGETDSFTPCHSEGEKRVLNEVKELKLLCFTQDELRISLRISSAKNLTSPRLPRR